MVHDAEWIMKWRDISNMASLIRKQRDILLFRENDGCCCKIVFIRNSTMVTRVPDVPWMGYIWY